MRQQLSLTSAVRAAVLLGAAAVMAAPAAAQQSAGSQQRQNTAATQPAKADVDDVSRHPDKYIGKSITVEGVVADVLGPHLFVIDDSRWFHLWGGMLVVVPEPFAAIVRTGAPVRVTGTVQKEVLAEAKRKWSFLNDPKIEVDLFEKPVIVASEVTTIAPSLVSLRVESGQPVGTSGAGAAAPVTDIKQLSSASDSSLVGRKVDVSGTVVRTEGNGFWIRTAAGEEVFVLPSSGKPAQVRAGQTANVRGTVLETPRDTKNTGGKGKNEVYVYADQVAQK